MHLVENESQIRKSLTTYRPSWPQLTRFDMLAAYTIYVYSDQSTVPPKVYERINEEGDTDIIQDPCFHAVRFYGFMFSWVGFVKVRVSPTVAATEASASLYTGKP